MIECSLPITVTVTTIVTTIVIQLHNSLRFSSPSPAPPAHF
jgi:hypothetical protein